MGKYGVMVIVLIFVLISANFAQNPDLMLSKAERDSILKHYHRIFPIWGKKVIEKGFDLPYPYGANVIYFFMTQGIQIDNIQLSLKDNPLQQIDFIQFGKNKTVVNTVNARFDFWLFPFLNLYGLFGKGWSTTTVEPQIVLPNQTIPFESTVSQSGLYYGLGYTFAMGVKQNWISLDMNWTWTDLELLDKPLQARVTGLRFGRTFRLKGKKRISAWVGAMHQKFETETRGTIYLKDALPGNVIEDIVNIPNQPGWDELPQWKKDVILEFIDAINNRWETARVNYGLDKGPKYPWNMILGVNYEHTKHWHFRVETGLIKRYSLLLNLNYRF